MALNHLFKEKNSINLAIIVGLLGEFSSSMSSSLTEKERISKESIFIERLKRSQVSILPKSRVSFSSKLNNSSYSSYKVDLKFDVLANHIIVNTIIKDYLEAVNSIVLLSETIENKIKKIEQKRIVLDGWDKTEDKFYVLEKFLMLNKINFSNSEMKNLKIDSSEGQVTLPIISESVVSIKEISIKNGNGSAGNSDEAVTLNNMNLKNVLDGNPDTWFEYEKLDTGPVSLRLRITLEQPTIINKIKIEGYFKSQSNLNIKNITIINDAEATSVRESSKRNSRSLLQLSDEKNSREYSFLPRIAKYVIVELQSNDFERLENFRKRFSIGIKSNELKKVKYESSGTLYSEDHELIDDLNLVKKEIDGILLSENFCKIDLGYSFNDGEDWTTSEGMNIVPLGSDKMEWKLSLSRDDESFNYFNSFKNVEYEYEYKQYTFPGKKGIRHIGLPRKNISEKVFALENGFGKRSRKSYSNLSNLANYKLLKSDDSYKDESEYHSLDLPFDIFNSGIMAEEISIKINNIHYSLVENLEEVILNEKSFCISDNQKELLVNGKVPQKCSVKWKIDPEELMVEEDSKYYYFKFSNYFNPDFDSIKIVHLDNDRRTKREKLNSNRSVYKLKEKNIFSDSLKILDSDSNELARVEYSSDLDSSTFFFDEESGILKVKGNRGKMNFTASYEYESETTIDSKDFVLWVKEDILNGIKVKKERINAKRYKRNLKDSKSKFSLSRGTARTTGTINNNKRKFEIGSKGIVGNSINILTEKRKSEVGFLDGESEFQKIFLIENEETNSFEAPVSSDIISFKVSAGSKFLQALGIFFEDNAFFLSESATLVSQGDWKVSGDGTVEVFAPDGIPENIKYSYYYVSGEKLYDKFSFDKNNGFLYFSEAQESSDIEIEYKVIDAIAEYELCKEVKVKKSGKDKLLLNTDLFYNRVGDIRVFFKKDSGEKNLSTYREYYSPIIYSVGFRFR